MENYEILNQVDYIMNSFYNRTLKQFKCDCEWCNLHIQLLDNNMFEQLLIYSVKVEDYETSILIKSQLELRKQTNYVLSENKKNEIYLKLKKFKENKNKKNGIY